MITQITQPPNEFRIDDSGISFAAGSMSYAWFQLTDVAGASQFRAVTFKELTYLPIETRYDPDMLGKQ